MMMDEGDTVVHWKALSLHLTAPPGKRGVCFHLFESGLALWPVLTIGWDGSDLVQVLEPRPQETLWLLALRMFIWGHHMRKAGYPTRGYEAIWRTEALSWQPVPAASHVSETISESCKINCCSFKLLNFGFVCYTAIDHENSHYHCRQLPPFI